MVLLSYTLPSPARRLAWSVLFSTLFACVLLAYPVFVVWALY